MFVFNKKYLIEKFLWNCTKKEKQINLIINYLHVFMEHEIKNEILIHRFDNINSLLFFHHFLLFCDCSFVFFACNEMKINIKHSWILLLNNYTIYNDRATDFSEKENEKKLKNSNTQNMKNYIQNKDAKDWKFQAHKIQKNWI